MLTTEVNIGLAFLAGLASFLAPCVLPMVLAYLGYLSGHALPPATDAGPRRRYILAHAGAFVLGFTLIFVALGSAAGALGRLVPGAWLRYAGGLLLIVFGLSLAGLVRVPFLEGEARLHLTGKPDWRPASSLLAGLAFGAGWTPCIGPVLSTILVLGIDEATVGRGMLLLTAYALGLGLPFILAGLAVERIGGLLARIARYQPLIQRVVGAVVLLVGVMLLTDGFAPIGLWLEERGWGWDLGL